LNAVSQCAEIRYSLQFIIRQLNAKVMLQPSEQIQGLQAVNTQRLEEVIVGSKFLAAL